MGIINDQNVIDKIVEALTQVRPYLESDGGDSRLIEVTDDFVVKVKLLGACSDCHVSVMTLKAERVPSKKYFRSKRSC